MRYGLVIGALCFVCSLGSVSADEEPSQPNAAAPAAPRARRIARADGSVLHFYRTNFVPPAQLEKNLRQIARVGKSVGLHALSGQGILVLEGTPADVDAALAMAAHFDVGAPQVRVDVEVVLIRHVEAAGTVVQPADEKPNGDAKRTDVIVLGDGMSDGEILKALEIEGRAELLARASVLASEGITAEVDQSQQQSQLMAFEVRDGDKVHRATAIHTSLHLRVTPRHIGSNYVTLEAQPELKGVWDAIPLASPTHAPTHTTHKASTTLTIRSGQTVVLANLFSQRETERESEPSVALNQPLGGTAGPHPHHKSSRSEVVLKITARIVFPQPAPATTATTPSAPPSEGESAPPPTPDPQFKGMIGVWVADKEAMQADIESFLKPMMDSAKEMFEQMAADIEGMPDGPEKDQRKAEFERTQARMRDPLGSIAVTLNADGTYVVEADDEVAERGTWTVKGTAFSITATEEDGERKREADPRIGTIQDGRITIRPEADMPFDLVLKKK